VGTPQPTATASPTLTLCPGDCDSDGAIRIDELVAAVGAALGQSAEICDSVDRDRDGTVAIHELLGMVVAALTDCSAATAG
jgi:hypothetical protein